ncbi:hypothetical protein Enr10x_11470 [Gimesia panareensis]|uniref:Uncharacterized protein n=1 Tax=Gimesia panareensis TaxID=2527978 RepID=A0A517Q2J4_9PLAN|nr:hypothetical protein [Gimesia panareensis]QDT25849.1 hypothetical protein Enr10x_11470 [Gimesia panareensis]
MQRHQTIRTARNRRGVITPLAALVLLVVMAGIALIVNRLWLDAASLEVTTCVETAALAAGHEMVSDELLKEKPDYQSLMQRAERSANQALKLNSVAGQQVGIKLTKGENLLFGKSVPVVETGIRRFLQTDHEPTSIQIQTKSPGRIANPVAEFLSDLTRSHAGSAGPQIQATLDNHVRGVRPFENVAVPAYPLGILKNDPTGKHTQTWELQIDQKQGKDEYRYDPKTKTVSKGPDGIPEIILTGKPRRGDISDANMQILNFGSRFKTNIVTRQILTGLTRKNLKHFQGELLFDAGPLPVKCSPNIENGEQDAFQEMIGQCRICFLYDQLETQSGSYEGTALCTNLVGGRIMSVQRLENQACEIILQPGVLSSRAVVLAVPEDSANLNQPVQQIKQTVNQAGQTAGLKKPHQNKYIYKLFLTQ